MLVMEVLVPVLACAKVVLVVPGGSVGVGAIN